MITVLAFLFLGLTCGFMLGAYCERRAERRDPRTAAELRSLDEAIAAKDRRIHSLEKSLARVTHQRNEVMEALRRERDMRAS